MKFNTTVIPQEFRKKCFDINLDWEPNDTDPLFGAVVVAMTELLSNCKNKAKKVACKVEDTRGNFKFAGIVQYHPNEENEEMPGNWSYVLTFDPKDIKNEEKPEEGCDEVYTCNDPYFYKLLTTTFLDKFNRSFAVGDAITHEFIMYMADTMLEWLDANAESEDSKIEHDFFEASAAVENGQKVFSIVPSAELKCMIKDDAAIQK